jgi:Brp/Blh family beta-carotene 15,15'-monooxygenase
MTTRSVELESTGSAELAPNGDGVAGGPMVGHALLALGVLVGVSAAFGSLPGEGADPAAALLWPLIAIAVFGVPHGASDVVFLWKPGVLRVTAQRFVVYALIVQVVFVVWWLVPVVALTGFLLLSVVHFGEGDARVFPAGWPRAVEAWLRGVTPVLGPIVAAPLAAGHLLDLLLPAATAGEEPSSASVGPATEWLLAWRWPLVGVLGVAVAALVLRVVFVALRNTSLRTRRASALVGVEVCALAIAVWFLPPLVFFAVYFCAWHAPRHLAWVRRRSGWAWTDLLLASFATTLAAAVVVVPILAWLPPSSLEEGAMRFVFIGLAALTVPHAFLVERSVRASGG